MSTFPVPASSSTIRIRLALSCQDKTTRRLLTNTNLWHEVVIFFPMVRHIGRSYYNGSTGRTSWETKQVCALTHIPRILLGFQVNLHLTVSLSPVTSRTFPISPPAFQFSSNWICLARVCALRVNTGFDSSSLWRRHTLSSLTGPIGLVVV